MSSVRLLVAFFANARVSGRELKLFILERSVARKANGRTQRADDPCAKVERALRGRRGRRRQLRSCAALFDFLQVEDEARHEDRGDAEDGRGGGGH